MSHAFSRFLKSHLSSLVTAYWLDKVLALQEMLIFGSFNSEFKTGFKKTKYLSECVFGKFCVAYYNLDSNCFVADVLETCAPC